MLSGAKIVQNGDEISIRSKWRGGEVRNRFRKTRAVIRANQATDSQDGGYVRVWRERVPRTVIGDGPGRVSEFTAR
jgi:hypothetical protein